MRFSHNLRKEIERDPKAMARVIQGIFKSPNGKKFLVWLFMKSGFFEVGLDDDTEKINRGKRYLMMEILQLLQIPAESFAVQAEDETDIFLDEILNMEEAE